MFEYQPRRHPLQTFQFWFALLICSGGVAAWRFGVFSRSEAPQPLQSEIVVIEEEMPPPPQATESDIATAAMFNNAGMAPQQSEEPGRLVVNDSSGVQALAEPDSSQEFQIETANGDAPQQSETTHAEITQISLTQQSTPPTSFQLQETPEVDESEMKTAAVEEKLVRQPTPVSSDQFDFTEVDQLIERGEDVTALRTLSTWYWEHPDRRRQLWNRLNLLSRRIYFQPHPHYMPPHEIQFGDRLETIAKKHQVSWEYLAKINRVDAQRIKAGKKLKVIQGPFSAIVDLSEFEITVHAHGYFVVRMPVGVGKDGSTPIGTFKVTDKVVDPIYYGPDIVIKNDDPSNPLGERWLAISDEAGTIEGYGIHGTIDPASIGKAESRGCIRLHDQDIADLYDLLTIGSEIIIRR